ncbi:MAG: polysaccharide biosynthesis tyrosine autokinase [Alphaproteobacteria bacterium]|nr:polysaccharide biosynthesis tyrosine autokinase [Alphaproteobacteria bacterium]
MLDRSRSNLPADRDRTAAVPMPFAGEGLRPENFGYEQPDRFDPVKLLWYLIQYRWLIVSVLLVALIVGLAATLMMTPKYRATALVELMAPSARVLEEFNVVVQSTDARAFETARQKFLSRDLSRRVVQALNLAQNPQFLFPRPDFSVGNIFSRVFGTSPTANLADFDAEQRQRIAVSRLRDGLSVSVVRNTSLLSINFSSPNPRLASDIANQTVASFMDLQIDQTVETSDLARRFIQEQIGLITTKLQDSERALVAYAQAQGISSAGDNGSLVSANITAINASLSEAIQRRLSKERVVAQIDAGEGTRLLQVLESEAVQRTQGNVAELKAEYSQKLRTFKPGFPEMLSLASQIAELERQVENQISIITGSIRLELEEPTREEVDLRSALRQLEVEQVDFQDKNIQYTILNREVESNRSQYQSLIDSLNSLGVSDVRRANIDVIEAAITPVGAFSPRMPINLAVALAIGAALGATIIYIAELLNNRFNTPDQIESELALPVLGIIPHVDPAEIASVLADQRSGLSEAYRSLRTSLQFATATGAPRTMVVTSAEPGESKSTTVYKLADEFGALGHSVLVIDADLRRPSLHRMFKTDNSIGLTNLLTGTVDSTEINEAFQSTDLNNVVFLSSGPMVPNPADILSSQRMASVIHACREKYDFVLIDGPPVLGLSDSPILSRQVEAAVMVVSAHQVARKSAKAALKRLRATGGNVIGAVLSKLDVEKVEYSYAYRYMYEGYYSYGEDQKQLPAAERRNEGSTGSLDATFGKMRNAGTDLYKRFLRPLVRPK